MADLTPEQKAELRKVFRAVPDEACRWCGGFHLRACGRVKRQVFVGQGAGAGNLVEVEFWKKWDDSEVIYPEDAFGDLGLVIGCDPGHFQ